jgi:hypothetical protein
MFRAPVLAGILQQFIAPRLLSSFETALLAARDDPGISQ